MQCVFDRLHPKWGALCTLNTAKPDDSGNNRVCCRLNVLSKSLGHKVDSKYKSGNRQPAKSLQAIIGT